MGDGAHSGVLDKRPEELTEADIIYDWNSIERRGSLFKHKISFFDETLRDGVQCPSVVDPKIEDKIKLVHLMNDVGIDHVNIGLPGAGRSSSTRSRSSTRRCATACSVRRGSIRRSRTRSRSCS